MLTGRIAFLGTPGGRVHVLDMNNALPMAMGDIVGEGRSFDHGFGGMALCVEPLSGRPNPTIFFATTYAHSTKNSATNAVEPLSSSLHVYEWVGGGLTESSSILFDDSNLSAPQPRRPNLIGICGLAVGDLVDEALPSGITEELIVATLQGDVAIFDLQEVAGDVVVNPIPLFHQIYDGAVGANNSIWVDSSGSTRRLFAAGSMGMRVWQVSTP